MGYGLKNIGSTATLIVSDNSKRKRLEIVNTSEIAIVAIGPDSSVTTLNAAAILYPAQARQNIRVERDWLGPVYGIISSSYGNAKVFYWEVEASL